MLVKGKQRFQKKAEVLEVVHRIVSLMEQKTIDFIKIVDLFVVLTIVLVVYREVNQAEEVVLKGITVSKLKIRKELEG